jgi:excisionase family DNA binding protein
MKERPGQERLTYSITEVAEMLGISRSMAYEGVHRGEIPAVRIGRRVLVPKDRVAELLELDVDHGVELR